MQKKTLVGKLKDRVDRYVITHWEGKPLFILKKQRDSLSMVNIIRKSLLYHVPVYIETDTDNPDQLISVRIAISEDELRKLNCPDSPEYTQAFWEKQKCDEFRSRGVVQWVRKFADCRLYAIPFCNYPSIHFLHENHPRFRKILDVAWKSVNEDYEVVFNLYRKKLFYYICDMKLTGKKLE